MPSRRSTAGRSAGPTSSTSRCSAPPRSRTRTRRSPSIAAQQPYGRSRSRSTRTRPRRPGRRSSKRTTRTTRRSRSSRSFTPPPVGGSPWSSSTLRRLDSREEVSDKTELLRKIAHVFEDHLDDKEQALEALVNALEEDFHDRETARYLERMAQATGKWGDVIQRANAWLAQQTDPAQKIRLCLHLAKWYGEDLGHPEYAQPYYAQIVQLDPNNVGALRQMGQLYRKGANWQQLGATLLPRARRRHDGPRSQGDADASSESCSTPQMSPDRAGLTYFQRALEVDAQFIPAIENLERIYTARGQNRELVDILARKVPALSSPRRHRGHEAAHRVPLRDDPRRPHAAPRRSTAEVVDIDPANIMGLRGLSRVYEQLQQWADLVRVLEAQLDGRRHRAGEDRHPARSSPVSRRSTSSRRISRRRASSRSSRSTPTTTGVLPRAELPKLRKWEELINAYERRVERDARAQDQGRPLLRPERRCSRTRSRTSKRNHRRLPNISSTSTRPTSRRSKPSRGSTRSRE